MTQKSFLKGTGKLGHVLFAAELSQPGCGRGMGAQMGTDPITALCLNAASPSLLVSPQTTRSVVPAHALLTMGTC